MTTQNPPTKAYNSIDAYKQDYHLFAQFKGTRYKIIQSLEKHLESFQSIALKANKPTFKKTYYYNFEELSEKIQAFLKANFPDAVCEHFTSIPKYPSEGNLGSAIAVALMTPEHKTYKEKILAQEEFLIYMKNCLEDYGLHKEIDTRIPLLCGRYLVSITHNHMRKTNKREVSHVLPETEMRQEFLTPYLDRVDISIGGNKLPYEAISNFRIARLVLLDDEIPLFKEKHRLTSKGNKGLFDKSKDVTHRFITTSKVNHNFVIGK